MYFSVPGVSGDVRLQRVCCHWYDDVDCVLVLTGVVPCFAARCGPWPDDDYYWWGETVGPTYRLIVANAEHSFATGIPTLLPSIAGFVEGLLAQATPPSFTWNIDATTGAITILSKTPPAKVIMRFATTSDGIRRDFRLIKGNTPLDPCHSIPIHVRRWGCGCSDVQCRRLGGMLGGRGAMWCRAVPHQVEALCVLASFRHRGHVLPGTAAGAAVALHHWR